ncbi:arrestin domain-containing protein [Paraphaeosphaeria minitans]|uniref:Arrestin domain-containing protein n=1 Tax=Paraphaeosphaeria minitans TaxID=565426 RepID=A0A9P6KM45_9PLEO|nr:arrestin domain-containing protein [Paraphaeosphaeria minitans]
MVPQPAPARRDPNTMHTLGSHLQYRVLQIAHYGQPTIDIELDESQHEANRAIFSYSTMDTMEIEIAFTGENCPDESRLSRLLIVGTGTAHVFVERLTTTPSMSGRTEAFHKFLALKMPLNPDDIPSPRILRAGEKYTFPFVFTIPTQLLPKACPHAVASDYVRQMHLMLPPSMGDAELSGFGRILVDDMAPEMAKITYGVKAQIMQLHEDKLVLLAQKTRKVRVKPAFEEQPPLNTDGNREFRPRLERNIKKGLFKGRTGTLIAQAIQPKPLVIPGARTLDAGPIATRAKVYLRFDPADENSLPPKLGSLKTSMKASTFYSSSARSNFPTRESLSYDHTQGAYTDTISISTMCIGTTAQWERQSPSANPPTEEDIERRDSGICNCSGLSAPSYKSNIPPPSSNYKGGSFYTASIVVPITMPLDKNFLPTFHSCLVSRVYALSMNLSVHAPGLGDPTLALKVPLQVCAEGSATGNENARARSEEAAGILAEADRILSPRSVALLSMDQPPEYVALSSRVTAAG